MIDEKALLQGAQRYAKRLYGEQYNSIESSHVEVACDIIEAYEAARAPTKRLDEARAVQVMTRAMRESKSNEYEDDAIAAYRALLSIADVVENPPTDKTS